MATLSHEAIQQLLDYYNNLSMQGASLDGWVRNQDAIYGDLLNVESVSDKSLGNSSCLDVGCGTGELWKRLKSKGVRQYLGIDINKPALERARIIHTGGQFKEGEFLQMRFDQKFDFVFLSGVFAFQIQNVDQFKYMQGMLEKAYSLAKYCVVYNFQNSTLPLQSEKGAFFDLRDAINIATRITGKQDKVKFAHTGEFDETMYLFR